LLLSASSGAKYDEKSGLAFGDAVLIAGEAPADPGQAAQFQPVAARVRKFGLDLPR
jgi:hypothetical protein